MLPRKVKNLLSKCLAALPAPAQRHALNLYKSCFVFGLDAVGNILGAGSYPRWIRRFDTLSAADRRAIQADIARMGELPLISVVVPVFNTPERYLRAALELGSPSALPELATMHCQ